MRAYSKKHNYLIKYHAKSGCSVFRQLFFYLHKTERKINNSTHHNININFLYNGNKCIKIHLVRDPYNRVVSMFTNKYCARKGMNTLYDKIHLEKDTFEDFVKYLLQCSKTGKYCDIHIKPQYISYEGDDIIIKLKNFNKEIMEVYSKPELSHLLPKVEQFFKEKKFVRNMSNRGNEDNKFIGKNVYDKFHDGPWSNYKYFYNKEIADMVYEAYKRDFITFNYEKDSIFN